MTNQRSQPGPPAVSCHGLSISYSGQQVLDDVSMTVHSGRVHALLGPNGAGKSTWFRIILGLEDRHSGSVGILGEPRDRQSLLNIGASVNGPALYPHLSARENGRVHARLLGLDDDSVDSVLATVGLGDTGRKRVKSFSTGMKARLALAIAMLGTPPILLLDEPQNGLDPQGIADLRFFLREWADQGGTVLVSSHQLGEVARLADDITILAATRAAYSGPVSDFAAPGHLEEEFFRLTQGQSVPEAGR
ncbi:ATP-binding cassette domain-containing protein [Corynebacterium glyciniphilum]|uniref:ATP-binding cassette domain-containing protein n=1 Tax=Corynebacterium glyciniphilum TaxID=1404244 RepID=UPI00264DA434|nr:ATP-binding cassette domain-containing protein [Corynebacterium glyciniphilum]MDN5684369.1 ATP-binding cassette domain-containing protein [Corynebacterium glyciniphilum]MDN6707215.1 ATP-binding cassette domain-containing protein [Corynebacterium glyciniphilum]